jgi:hypothetical protein
MPETYESLERRCRAARVRVAELEAERDTLAAGVLVANGVFEWLGESSLVRDEDAWMSALNLAQELRRQSEAKEDKP